MKCKHWSEGGKNWIFIAFFAICLVFPLKSGAADGIELTDISNHLTSVGTMEGDSGDYQLDFIKKDKTEVSVSFSDLNKHIGLNETPKESGFWVFKSYFIGWSDNEKYMEDGKGKLFYETATAKEVKEAGIASGTKLYALYADSSIMRKMSDLTSININNDVAAKEFVSGGDPVKDQDKTTAVYSENNDMYDICTINARFKMNPFVAAAIYKDPWVGALDNGSDWSALGKKKGRITVVDLHVHLDERLVLPEEFELTFHSYTFRPISIRSAIKKDGSPVGDNEIYPYLGIDQPGDEPGYGILNRIEKDNPDTIFKVQSYLENDQGDKVPIYDYIIRTRVRTGFDQYGNKITPASMEQIQSDMTLSLKNGSFKVTNQDAKAIADKTAEPIKVSGFVDGLVKGTYWGPVTSEEELLDFVYKNSPPIITSEDKSIKQGEALDLLTLVTSAEDPEDGDLKGTANVIVKDKGGFDKDKVGTYTVIFQVIDNKGAIATSTSKVTVKPKPTPNKPNSGGTSSTVSNPGNNGVIDPDTNKLNKSDHFAYMFGYPDGIFMPNRSMTRAEVAAMLSRLLVDRPDKDEHHGSTYSDLSQDAWYYHVIDNMTYRNILKGYPDRTFGPDKAITRAEFAAMVSRFDKLDSGNKQYPDVPADHWAANVISAASDKGWVSGYPDGTFGPDQPITRAEVIAVTNRLLNRSADQTFIEQHPGDITQFTDMLDHSYWAYYTIMEATNGHDFERLANGKDEHWLALNGKAIH